MKLAFLGYDADAERVARAAVAGTEHQVVALWGDDAAAEALRALAPSVSRLPDWESLVAAPGIDAVVVGRRREAGGEPLKKLVQEGVPLLVIHPLGDPLLALELDMIRRDGQGPIVTCFPGAGHPALGQLREWIEQGADGPLGPVEQCVLVRALAERGRETVLFQLARDVESLRSLIGSINRVNATGPAADAEAWSNLSVTLSGPGMVVARWSVEPVSAGAAATLTVIGQRGRATLELADDWSRWKLVMSWSPDVRDHWPSGSAEEDALAQLERARQGAVCEPNWSAVCRDLEVADTVELSLRRGRLIELHHEQVTEEDTFKGVMAALGCLLLLGVPLVLLAAALIDGVTYRSRVAELRAAASSSDAPPGATAQSGGNREEVAGGAVDGRRPLWPWFLLAPFVLFLLLQLLKLVFARPPARSAQP
ncbi:MAG: hypothetical protein U0935_11230 [Pirellulales bacterium]